MDYSRLSDEQLIALKAYRDGGPEALDDDQLRTVRTLLTPPEEPEATGRDLVRSAAQGATFGFSDELQGALYATFNALDPSTDGSWRENYRAYVESEREDLESFREHHPGKAFAAELAGGLFTGAAGGAKAAGTQLGRRVAAMPFRSRLGVASGAGAAGGAVAGLGTSESGLDDPLGLLGDVATGAAAGAVLGPVAEGIGTGVRKGAQLARDWVDPEAGAKRQVAGAIRENFATPEAAAERYASIGGRGTTLADIGEGTRAELEMLTQLPGNTAERAVEQLGERSMRQAEQLTPFFGRGRMYQQLDELARIRSEQASPLYERAFDAGVEHTDELDNIFRSLDEVDPGRWGKVKREGRLSHFAETGEVLGETALGDAVPSLRGWQAMKESLDSDIGTMLRAGDNKRAGVRMKIRDRLLAELDRQNTDYRDARQLWAGASRYEEMLEEGRKLFNAPSSQFAHTWEQLDKVDKEAVRAGFAQALTDKFNKAGDLHDLTKYLNNKDIRKKAKLILGPPRAAAFLRAVKAERKKQQTMTQVSPRAQSATARRQQRMATRVPRELMQFARAPWSRTMDALQMGAELATQPTTAQRDLAGELLLSGLPRGGQARVDALRAIMEPGPLPPVSGSAATALAVPATMGLATGFAAGR